VKKKKTYETLDRQLAALFGDPVSADASELQAISERSVDDTNLLQKLQELARRTAQECRSAGKPVPPHVAAILAQLKQSNTLEGASPSMLSEVIDSVLNPFRGPAQRLAFNYHRLKEKSDRDERLLEELGEEVKRDWTEDEEQ
jgi:hypothetical protein